MKFLPDVRSIIAGPALRGETVWHEYLILPGTAPVLSVRTQAVHAPGTGYTNIETGSGFHDAAHGLERNET